MFQLSMEKKLLKQIEGMEDAEREKLRELLKDSNKPYVSLFMPHLHAVGFVWCCLVAEFSSF